MHIDYLLFKLFDEMHLMGNENPFLDQAQGLVKAAIDILSEHTNQNTAELDRIHPVRPGKGAVRRRRVCEQVVVNAHTMGTSFV